MLWHNEHYTIYTLAISLFRCNWCRKKRKSLEIWNTLKLSRITQRIDFSNFQIIWKIVTNRIIIEMVATWLKHFVKQNVFLWNYISNAPNWNFWSSMLQSYNNGIRSKIDLKCFQNDFKITQKTLQNCTKIACAFRIEDRLINLESESTSAVRFSKCLIGFPL